jgi:NAD(P)-dependent dehydrogenase (short-subunit alcohol dehydrogenase family)
MLNYEGKRVVMCGCHSGIGFEVTRLLLENGARVTGLDIKSTTLAVDDFIQLDLSDEATIETALGRIDGPLDAVIMTSAIPHKTNPGINCQIVNFVGVRRLIEGLVPKIQRGGAIAIASSGGGAGYVNHMPDLLDLVSNHRSFEEGRTWSENHLDLVGEGYFFSKECINVYVMWRAYSLLHDHAIRLNCIAPGAVDTEAMNRWAIETGDPIKATIGKNPKPVQQAWPLLFLASDLASVINGQILWTEQGMMNAALTGQLNPAAGYPEMTGDGNE